MLLKDIFYRLPSLYDFVVCPRSFSKIAYRVVQVRYDFVVWAGRKHIVVPERIRIASGTVRTRGLAYFVANDLSTLAQFVVWPEASIIRPDAILPALVQFPGCQTSGSANCEGLGISSSANRTPERDLLFGVEILGNSAGRGGLVVTFVIGHAAPAAWRAASACLRSSMSISKWSQRRMLPCGSRRGRPRTLYHR